MSRRTIALLGSPIITEEGAATEVIQPGMLIDGQTSIALSAVDGLKAPIRVALERDEMGRGIDSAFGASLDTNAQAGEDPNYAVGETVKVGAFHAGQRFVGFIASGQDITANDLLEAAGDGTFESLAGAEPLVRAVETLNADTLPDPIHIRLEAL